ncbi:MAG TPA: tetratricopeptide repeat protein [Bacteroidales bacterium]|mgnify:FL=1|nr:tetratricopeptide repeat protein [Bacteroidales bacterium]HOR81516.1 tetratricopeptide repeat protein [Bacteroidales bacterium]HPJ90691.1 tetratricopeptide repeat protein [Bacteroidales bacterium]
MKNNFYKIVFFLSLLSSVLTVKAQTNEEQLAIQYFKNQEYEKAVELFKGLYDKRSDAYYFNYYFETLVALKDFKSAERIVHKQIRLYPSIQKYKVDLGRIYELQGESKKAKKQFESCVLQNDLNSISVKELAVAFQQYQLTDYAIKTYLRAREISKNTYDYAIELAQLYAIGNDYQKAIDELLLLVGNVPAEQSAVEGILLNWLINDQQQTKQAIIKNNILKYSNKNPDIQVYSSLLLWLAMQEKDFSSALKQAIAMDKRYRENGRTVFEIANISAENQDLKTAIEGFNYILNEKEKGNPFYEAAKMASLRTKYQQIVHSFPKKTEDIQLLDKNLQSFFSEYRLQPLNIQLFREWVLLKSLYANDINTAKQLLEDAVYKQNIPPKEKAVLKLDLGDLLLLDEDVWEATLLYSQVEKDFANDTIGHLAKFKNAKLSFYLGEFDWAEAQLDVLRAATSKLIANDAMYLSLLIADNKTEDSLSPALMYFARASFFLENNRIEDAEIMLDSISQVSIYHSLADDILYKRAEIAIKKQQYHKADSLLNKLITAFPYDLLADDALFLRANINEMYLKDVFTAMELYLKLIKDFPSSIYIIDARNRFRLLRGDILQ